MPNVELTIDDRGARIIAADLPQVFVDGDVVAHRSGGVPAIGTDLESAHAAVVERAAAALEAAGSRTHVEVVGSGVLANVIRRAVTEPGEQPTAALIDTTGNAEQIADALARLPAGAVLVLAAWAPQPTIAVDPYTDLHRPGVLVRTPTATASDLPGVEVGDPVSATYGQPLPAGEWFVLSP